MADIVDDGNELAQLHLDMALKNRPKWRTLDPTGNCHYCGEPVEFPKVYCDDACAEDHEWILLRQQLNRRV